MIWDGVDGQDRCLLLLSNTLTQLNQESLRKNGAQLHAGEKSEKKYKWGSSTLNEQSI